MSKAERGIADAVAAGLRDAVASPSTAMQAGDVPAATAAVTERMGPVLEHLANAEPWWQSRVTWGAIIAAATPILGALGIATDWIDPDQVAAVLVAVGSAIGGMITLYGRWRATRPIGR